VIAVTALTSSGDKASWANYGATTVDLAAPGLGIYSTTPNGTYSSFSGTSMATPHVTGAVALYAAQNPGATAAQIREAILGSTTPTPSVNGISVTNGRLNIGNFMAAPASEPDPLAPPDGLVAAAVAHDQINLTWVDHSTDPAEDGFEIDRCQGAGCTSFTQIAVVGANVTTYSNIGVAGSTTYRYRVRATNAVGDSTDSNVAEATTPSAPAPPSAPDGLVATAVAHDRINLTWADRSADPAETGFEIDRCQGSTCTSFTQIATVGANVTSYSSTGLASNTNYRYRVRASNALGDSANSNVALARTLAITSPPPAPSDLTATAGPAARQITLNWQDNATTESSFRIYRCSGTTCDSFSHIATVGANVTTFVDRDRTSGRIYRYRVRANNSQGNSSYSNIASATAP
jgi:hypothetical protein